MRHRTTAALALFALLAGCGGAQPPPQGQALSPDLLPPVPLAAVAAGSLGELEAALDRRFHTPVRTLGALSADGPEQVVLLFTFESFAAWRAWRALEPFEREDAEWSAEDERDLWTLGLEAAGVAEEAQRLAEPGLAACSEAAACEEGAIWEEVLERLDVDRRCLADRVGVARFRGATLAAAHLFEGNRCEAEASRLLPHELDGQPGQELVVELLFRSGVALEAAELQILGEDLERQVSRRLFERAPGSRGEPRPEGRYWFEELGGGPTPELVIEALTLEAGCELPAPCSRFSRRLPSPALDEVLGPSCFPRGAEARCGFEVTDHQALAFDPQRRIWL